MFAANGSKVMSTLVHPDSDWTPRLAWGDSIPLRWVRVSPGEWVVWPPQQFETVEPGGPNIWRFGDWGGYHPVKPCEIVPADEKAETGESREAPATEWGSSAQTRWSLYDDGRVVVSMCDLKVNLSPCTVGFKLTRYGDRKLIQFFPDFIWEPPTVTPSPWALARGVKGAFNSRRRTWFYPTPEGRRLVANVWIEPTGVRVRSLDKLLPLELPSEAELTSDEQELRKIYGLEEAAPLHLRPHSRMLRDLANSAILMDLVGDDAFAAQFNRFILDNQFIHEPSGNIVEFSSDNNGAWMLSVLRRYGEIWQDCEVFRNALPHQVDWSFTLKRLFQEVGYTIFACPPIDEEARRAQLKIIAHSIPCSIGEHVFNQSGVPLPVVLAWAMGHFWSEEEGWREPEFPLTSEKYRSLVGGHLPTALEVVKLIGVGEIRLPD